MRELKFRIWNTLEGKWHGIHYKEPKMIGELICKQGVHLVPESVSRNLIVQQYTGLKDKNGKEIYEGDIVHYVFDGASHPKEAQNKYLTCVYDPDFGLFCFDDADSSYYWAEIRGYVEIIGNIFENSELLKQ